MDLVVDRGGRERRARLRTVGEAADLADLDGRDGAFWNAPFGASLAYGDVGTVDDVVAFFSNGLRLATELR